MPRGKRTVFMATCNNPKNPDCSQRVWTVRLHKQNSKGVGWKDFKVEKFCPNCRIKVPVKLKEEKHSN